MVIWRNKHYPTPVTIFPSGPVLDASSKNICHTPMPEVMFASMTSSGISSVALKSLELDELLRNLRVLGP